MNHLAVAIALTLFPGLIASIIADKLTVKAQKWEYFKYSIYSFVFGLLSYILLDVFLKISSLYISILKGQPNLEERYRLKTWSILTANSGAVPISEIISASFISIPLSLLAVWIYNTKQLNKIGNKLKLSHKYGDENLYTFFLTSKDIDWIYVRNPTDNLTYEGRIQSYSESSDYQELVLFNVAVYDYLTSEFLYDLPSVYICKKKGSLIFESIPLEFFKA